MFKTFRRDDKECVQLWWSCKAPNTPGHVHRMVVNLIGQLLKQATIYIDGFERPDDSYPLERLVTALTHCIDTQIAKTQVLCVIDSFQHYESEPEQQQSRQVLQALSNLAINMRNTDGRSSKVRFKILVTTTSACNSLTEETLNRLSAGTEDTAKTKDTIKGLDVSGELRAPGRETIKDVGPTVSSRGLSKTGKQR